PTRAGYGTRVSVARMLAAPGPGRSTAPGPSTETSPVLGMQNTDTSVAWPVVPSGTSAPAAPPVSTTSVQRSVIVVVPKQPCFTPDGAWGSSVWPGQKSPFASAFRLVPVTSGVRSRTNGGETEPSLPSGRQSAESAAAFVLVHASPVRTPRSHVPVFGW